MLRVILYKDELYRLPPSCQGIQVLDGQAWLVIAGQDIILTPGEKAWLNSDEDVRLVSALGNTPLILEVIGHSSTIPGSSIPQAITALVRPNYSDHSISELSQPCSRARQNSEGEFCV